MAPAVRGTPDAYHVMENMKDVAQQFASNRHERQRRRHLVQNDFDLLEDAGYLRTGIPVEFGGVFESVERSTRPLANAIRVLAQGDCSVALVASMHPAVIYSGRWLVYPEVPSPYTDTWKAQREQIFTSAHEGHWWGTITSEPGSAGNLMNTRAVARPAPSGNGKYLLNGEKHFGSGSGITSFMITTAVPEGEDAPDWFILDMRDVPWDGSQGVTLVAEWDGHGMTSTQSHGMRFEAFPATRNAYPGWLTRDEKANFGFVPCLFTAVIVGIVQVAVQTARERLQPRHDTLSAYEQVEWTKVQQEAWLIEQAFEGMLHATEELNGRGTLRGKMAIAELAETLMTRLCRVMGGGSFARHSPFGFWFEDVRALGFLRPPWALAYTALDELGWEVTCPLETGPGTKTVPN